MSAVEFRRSGNNLPCPRWLNSVRTPERAVNPLPLPTGPSLAVNLSPPRRGFAVGAICPRPALPAFVLASTHTRTHLSYYLWVYYFLATLLFSLRPVPPFRRDPHILLSSGSLLRWAKSFRWALKTFFHCKCCNFSQLFEQHFFHIPPAPRVPRGMPSSLMRLCLRYLFSGFIYIPFEGGVLGF